MIPAESSKPPVLVGTHEVMFFEERWQESHQAIHKSVNHKLPIPF
jgi:hypothetical protein